MTGEPIRFGTDGWRAGIADEYTFANVRRVAQGFAHFVRREWSWENGIVVGYDRRFGSPEFARATAEVLAATGIPAFLVDRPCPTPVAAFSVARVGAAGAVMITASHNPPSDNGFKIRTASGAALPPASLEKVEAAVAAVTPAAIRQLGTPQVGQVKSFDPANAYLRHVPNLLDLLALRRREVIVVVDAMYGSGAGWLPQFLNGGKLQVREIHPEWNPAFPGLARPEPIPPQTDALGEAVRQARAAVGLALDGDADRLGVVDEHGQFVDQLRTIALLAYYMLEHRGDRRPLVKTLTTTAMMERLGQLYDVPVHETGVGMKYVAPTMRNTNAVMGGEESGGYVFGMHMPERDGIVAGLFFLDLMAREDKSPSELVEKLFQKLGREYHYRRLDLRFPAEDREAIMARMAAWTPESIDGTPVARRGDFDGFKCYLADESWLLVRFSGTEPLLRIYCETTSADRVDRLLDIGRSVAGVQ